MKKEQLQIIDKRYLNALICTLVFFIFSNQVAGGGPVGEEPHFKEKADSIYLSLVQQLNDAKKNNSPGLAAQKYLQIGAFYQSSNLYSEAINQYNEALKLLKNPQEDSLYVLLNNGIGEIYLELNNFELAKSYFKEAVEVAIKQGYTRGEATAKGFLGTCYEKTNAYAEALQLQKESLALFEALQDSNGMAIAHENIGSIYEDLLEFDLAYQYFKNAYEFLEDSLNWSAANILNNLGDIHRKEGRYDYALGFTKKALKIAGQIEDYDQLESAHKDMAKLYNLMENYKLAYEHLQKASEYNELLLINQNSNQLNRLQAIYEVNKKEAQIKLLTEQNKVSTANQRLLLIVVFALGLILLILHYFNAKKRRADLKEREYQQRTLKAELENKAIKEKNLQQEVQLKTASLSKYSLHISQKNKILLDISQNLKAIAERRGIDYSKKINALAKEIDFNLQQENEWEEFVNHFKEIHPNFDKKLSSLSNNRLSPAEMRLGILLRLNLSTKEIASILRITPDSVRVARYRLRKKLPIDSKEDLISFLVNM